MWYLLSPSVRLTLTATLIVWAGWLVSWVTAATMGAPIAPIHSISVVVTIIGTVLVALFSLIWRKAWRLLPFLDRWQPDLTGQWDGKYTSSYKHPDTGLNATGPMSVTIRQGLFASTVSAKTGEMTSNSSRAWLESDRDAKRFRVGYTYRSEPKAAVRERSSPHDGVCWLTLEHGSRPRRLTGLYYTERRTIGDLEFTLTNPDP